MPAVICLLALLTGLPVAACAHTAEIGAADHPDPGSLVLVALGFCALLYALGATRLRIRHGGVISMSRIATMISGLLVVVIALSPPLDRIADRMLSAHMVQHLLLMLVAAPLIVWGRPVLALFWVLPRTARRSFARAWIRSNLGEVTRIFRRPTVAWISFSGSIAFWHLPIFYRWALANQVLHDLMHLTFLTSGLLFWSVVLEPSGKRRLDYGRAILFVFSTAMVTGLPGALLSLAQRLIYSPGDGSPPVFGLTPLEDQRLAGLLMWIPMDLMLFAVAGLLFAAWIRSADHKPIGVRVIAVSPLLLLPLFITLSGCSDSGYAALDARASRGSILIAQNGCGSCHEIPGIPSAGGLVGPSLQHFGKRIYIAGVLRNAPENLTKWLQNPQSIVPGNAMPDMHLDEKDAGDIAAYLSNLE